MKCSLHKKYFGEELVLPDVPPHNINTETYFVCWQCEFRSSKGEIEKERRVNDDRRD